jgi:hypothetical protein|tara:strand:+ start:428 stop:664 length:237 start_codon:yes stop_codon:yes gene_type:complete
MSNPHHLHQQYLDSTREGSTRQSRYPEGYMPKIEYYQAKLSIAVDVLDIEKIKFLSGKLEYFMERESLRNERISQLID